MQTRIYALFAVLLLGGCAVSTSSPAPSAPSKPAVDAVTTATPEAKKKSQDPRKVTAQQVRDRLAAMPKTHPRLFINSSSALSRFRDESGLCDEQRFLVARIRQAADDVMGSEAPPRRQTGRRLSTGNTFTSRVIALSSAWQMFGERRYADRCRDEMLSACAWSDWVPTHYLGVAEMLLGLAIGYDWCYDALGPDDRATILAAMKDKGFDEIKRQDSWWRKTNNNWGQVCWNGVTAAAIATAEDDPARAEALILEAVHALPRTFEPYAPVGAYPEGPGYWGYGTGRIVYLLAIWCSALGTDFGLADAPGFLHTGEYINALTGTSGFYFNYSDCGRSRRIADTLWWFAAQTGRTDWLAREYAALRAATAKWKETGKTEDVTGRFPALVLLWGRFPLVDAPSRLPLRYLSHGENPVAALRSGFTPDASFLGVKGGMPKYNHGHMDVGSFVFDADGVRWAEDLGSQNYHSIEKLGTFTLFDMKQNSSRWDVFRLGNESHNLVVVGTNRQMVAGFAHVVPAGLTTVQLDLSAIYGSCVKAAKRTFTLDRATRAATVRDDFSGVAPGTPLRWQMVTAGKVESREGNRLVLTQKGKRLLLHVETPKQVKWDVLELDKPVNPWDCTNKGFRRISFAIPAAADGTATISVTLAP
jgi:hypothetical protein